MRFQSAGRRESLKSEPGERQRGEVGEHVAGVGEKRQRAGDDAAGDLGEHEGAGEQRSEPHAPLIVGERGAVAVAMIRGMRSVHLASRQGLARVERVAHRLADEDQQAEHDGDDEEGGQPEPRRLEIVLALSQQLAERRRSRRQPEAEKVE